VKLYDTVLGLIEIKNKIKNNSVHDGDLSVMEENYFSQIIALCHEIANMTKCCATPDWQVDLFDEICCGNCGRLLKNKK